jgi:hypothetical protein
MRRTTVVLALLSAAAFAAVLTWQPHSDSAWQRIGYQILSQLWLLLAVIAFMVFVYEKFVRRRLTGELAKLSGPAIVGAMPPQQLMESFLGTVYGANEANRDVVAGLLGGDLTVSAHTDVHLKLSAVDHEIYRMSNTITYRFHKNVAADRFVIFATCEARLRDSIGYACEFPLFDLWFIADSELFTQAVDDLLSSSEIGMDYLDNRGQVHSTSFQHLPLKEVKYQDWSRYLPLFREAMGPFPRQHTHDFLSSLRIFDCSLNEMTGEGHVHSIERLSLRQATLQRIAEQYCYWQAPYPCYVDHVSIDAREFDTGRWEFSAMPFTFRASNVATRWLPGAELTSIDLRSWLLPGHGIVLIWRTTQV